MFQATEESSNSSSEESSIDDDCSVSTYRSALEVKEGVSDSDERELRENLIKHEEKDVRKAKCMVAFAFLVCAFAVCFSVFIFAKKGDEKSFELEYEGYVKDIKALVRWEVRYNFALMEQLGASVTIAANLLGSSFPYHTEPEFEITGGFVDGMGGIMSAAFAPLVKEEEREQWEAYSQQEQGWIENSKFLKEIHPVHRDALHGTIQDHEHDRQLEDTAQISKKIYRYIDGMEVVETTEPGKVYAPLWQVSPADYKPVNANLLADPRIAKLYEVAVKTKRAVLSENTEIGELFDFLFDPEEKSEKKKPHAFILEPVFQSFSDPTIVGILVGVTSFGNLLDRLLPEEKDGVIGVIEDNCGNVMSFELTSGKTEFLGYEDLHEPEFNKYGQSELNIEMYENTTEGLCVHNLHLYPSSKLRKTFDTHNPAVYTSVVAMAFVITAILLVVYDITVTRRQNKTMKAATRTHAIVTSLFPKEVGRQLVQEAYLKDENEKSNKGGKGSGFRSSDRHGASSGDKGQGAPASSKPMASYFPDTTICFADIVGFTAWSSMREPAQVFSLLETIYAAFDDIATRRRVFKVETIGDCYVSVAGLPTPRSDHALAMARFATDCLRKLNKLLPRLARELGPDTAELGMRIGLHSGPVTAGVLRGERARYQLFGDAVNTAARIESAGQKGRIHVSQQMADLLVASNREHWLEARSDKVVAKGKGELQTYWLVIKSDGAKSSSHASSSNSAESTSSSVEDFEQPGANDEHSRKINRMVEWNAACLQRLLQEIVARRVGKVESPEHVRAAEQRIQNSNSIAFDEVNDTISFANDMYSKEEVDISGVVLDPVVVSQLHEYVRAIATMYRRNPFHNYEHASHVTMSVVKLLNRVTLTEENNYGINADPLIRFALLWSALIHDVDHQGVPNAQLIKEHSSLAGAYNNKSVAEQNSVDLAWQLLMEDRYQELRETIYSTEEELLRFRQLVINSVLGTDVMDKELGQKRKARWVEIFNAPESACPAATAELLSQRKAAIVLEHIIQASDVAHTMQHWHIYRKWNTQLFLEMYKAFKAGRGEQNPADNWYAGEMGFFDFYVIPLATKLRDCGVFGSAGGEYLSYAVQNRNQWETQGKGIVEDLIERANRELAS